MANALFAKNKYGFVDGSISMPKEDSADFMNWKRCNAMVRGWLVSSMVKEIKNSVKYTATARDIWVDLEERFGKENAPRAYELRRTLTAIHQGNMSISAYYTKLRGVWDEIQSVTIMPTCSCNLCTCDIGKAIGIMRDKERLYDFLMGLNEEYNAIRTQILSSTPIPSVGAAFHLVSQDEQQRMIGNSRNNNTEASAIQVTGRNMRASGKPSSQYAYKRDERIKAEEKECTYCKKSGHTVDGCFEIIGYPEWWNKKPIGSRPQTQPATKTAAVMEEKQSPYFTKEEYDQLMRLIRGGKVKESNPNINMTGLTFEEPDWDG
ncbi:uncharacterized protein [Rutidosis leptorrhynchoides]|uniref:uncharacterized protein n=1 Tax=Rutidosis leptorrhynchoides TaxID=125765 RepID=UPI003A9954AF